MALSMLPPPVTPMPPPSAGAISFTSNTQIDQMQKDAAARLAAEQKAQNQTVDDQLATGLAGYVRTEYDTFKRHRDGASGWSQRLLASHRMFNGQYDQQHLSEIRKFNGSEGYLRMVAMKCRGASSLLRDVYLNTERPWGLQPPSDPDIPDDALMAVKQKVMAETQSHDMTPVTPDGQPSPPLSEDDIRDRTVALLRALKQGLKKKAAERCQMAEDKIDDLLQQGGFYTALAEFLVELPMFPFACIKGPVVKIYPVVTWENGKPVSKNRPRITYVRVSPYDIWFTPGVSNVEDADFVERLKYTRADLNVLLDLPGYDQDAVRNVLTDYGRGGLSDDWDSTDSSRALLENRENPLWNQSRLITGYEYHGNVQGLLLLQQGMDPKLIDDPLRDYAIECWVVGRYVLKVQLAPSGTRRHPYYITSFEKAPGTIVGNGLPDILGDIQDATNATFRALLNNMAMSSGPQVIVMDDRLSGTETGEDMYPWKRWHVNSDPYAKSASEKPIDFFQPNSNAQELLGVLQAMQAMGDDVSAIPRYLQGNSPGGGAGRTASGLAMLMGNASKILQTVASNIDIDIFDQALHSLLDLVLLTDTTDLLDGTEKVVVKGVQVAIQRETERSRQMELLQITSNPMDFQLMGPKGRATLIRNASKNVGLDGEQIVPSEDEIQAQQEQAKMLAAQQGIPGHSNQPTQDPGPDGQGGGGGPPQGDGSPNRGTPGGATGGGGMQPPGGGGQRTGPVKSSSMNAGPRVNSVGAPRKVGHFAEGGYVDPADFEVPAAFPTHTPPTFAPVTHVHMRNDEDDVLLSTIQKLAEGLTQQGKQIEELKSALTAPRKIIRDEQGRPTGSVVVTDIEAE